VCSSIQPVGHNRHGPKIGWGGCALLLEVAGSPSNTKLPEPRPTSIPSGILVYPAVWPQRTITENWGLCPFRGRELGPHLSSQCRVGRRLSPYQAASWSMQPFDHNMRGPKTGGSAPFLGRGAESSSNKTSLGPRPTSLPSGILVHPAVWPQYTNITDRTDRQRSDSIGWTVFTAQRSYASAVVGVVILSFRHTRALWLIQRTYRPHFYTTWKGNPSSFLMPKISANFQRGHPRQGHQTDVG